MDGTDGTRRDVKELRSKVESKLANLGVKLVSNESDELGFVLPDYKEMKRQEVEREKEKLKTKTEFSKINSKKSTKPTPKSESSSEEYLAVPHIPLSLQNKTNKMEVYSDSELDSDDDSS